MSAAPAHADGRIIHAMAFAAFQVHFTVSLLSAGKGERAACCAFVCFGKGSVVDLLQFRRAVFVVLPVASLRNGRHARLRVALPENSGMKFSTEDFRRTGCISFRYSTYGRFDRSYCN